MEVIIAPDFSTEALNIFKNKPNVRLLKVNSDQKDMLDLKKVRVEFYYKLQMMLKMNLKI